MRVIWSVEALRDIEAIYDYIARFNPPAASRTDGLPPQSRAATVEIARVWHGARRRG